MKHPVQAAIVGFVAGVGIGEVLFFVAFVGIFGICANYSVAEEAFPYALIVVPSIFSHPLIALLLAAVQFPLYGVILGFAWARDTKVFAGAPKS